MTQEQRLYYMAGFFDGEGCISITKCKNGGYPIYSVVIIIGQHDRGLLELFKAEFGGNIYLCKVRSIPWSYQRNLLLDDNGQYVFRGRPKVTQTLFRG